MNSTITVNELIKNLKRSPFILNSGMPLGYTAGLPVLKITGEKLYLVVPFLKYKITGETDKTLVYPIRYIATISIPEGKFVKFEDYSANEKMLKVDFAKPIGLFRHESIKHLNKSEYKEKRTELLSLYDKIIFSLLDGAEYTQKDETCFKELLNVIIEPSLKPFYRFIDGDFYRKYFD